MKIAERFHQPENFDAVADGAGWVMYAGGNDWENGITGVCVTFPSDEQLQRIWMTVKHKHDPGAESSEHADETKEWGQKAWRTWRREAVLAHRNKNHGTRSWQDAFKTALSSDPMKPYVKEWGTERSQWADVKESVYKRDLCGICGSPNVVTKSVFIDELETFMRGQPVMFATRRDPNTMQVLVCDDCKAVFHDNAWHPLSESLANGLLEAEDPEVERYLQQVKPRPYRLSKEFLRYVMGTPEGRKLLLHLRDQPEPPSEPHQVVREAIGVPDPEPSKEEVERLLPHKTYTLAGNSMIHAPGVIRMAQNEWRNGRKKQKTWAMNLIHAWEGLPEEVYLAILNDKVDIEAQGDNAVVTVKQY